MKATLKLLIRSYQRAISPALPPACRYQPTCSHYAYEAIDRHGALRGVWLALKRVGRCHPGRAGGYDPVPGRSDDSRLPDSRLPKSQFLKSQRPKHDPTPDSPPNLEAS